jgi:sulfur carrier protein
VISLHVNGRAIELDQPTPLLEYLLGLGVDQRAVAVEINGEILQRDAYDGCTLSQGDVVEIVRMVGGGLLAPNGCSTFYTPRQTARGWCQVPARPSSRRAASASARSSQGSAPPARTIVFSWPFPASSTVSPGLASASARRMAARRSSSIS